MMTTNIATDTEAGNALMQVAYGLNAFSSASNCYIVSGPGVLRIARGIIEPPALRIIASGDLMNQVAATVAGSQRIKENHALSVLRSGLDQGFPPMDTLWIDDRFNDRPAVAKAVAVALAQAETVGIRSVNRPDLEPTTARIATPFGAYLIELALSVERAGTPATRAVHRANARELLDAIGISNVAHELAELEASGVNVNPFRRWHARLINEIEGRAPKGFFGRIRSGATRSSHFFLGRDIDAETARVIERDFSPREKP